MSGRNLKLPYAWQPIGTVHKQTLEPGDVLPLAHDAYRVMETEPRVHEETGEQLLVVVLRPADLGDDPRDRDHDLHIATPLGNNRPWVVYPDPEHYPVCAACGEPVPCRHKMVEKVAAASAMQMERYSHPGVCPACSEPISTRQKSITFADNLVVPAGPPVSFHLKHACLFDARLYESHWHKADPANRHRQLSCDGSVTNHNDGTYECTQWPNCPGPTAMHRTYIICQCPDCHARGTFDCHPAPTSRLIERRTP